MLCKAPSATQCEQLATQQSAAYGNQKSQEFIGGYLTDIGQKRPVPARKNEEII